MRGSISRIKISVAFSSAAVLILAAVGGLARRAEGMLDGGKLTNLSSKKDSGNQIQKTAFLPISTGEVLKYAEYHGRVDKNIARRAI